MQIIFNEERPLTFEPGKVYSEIVLVPPNEYKTITFLAIKRATFEEYKEFIKSDYPDWYEMILRGQNRWPNSDAEYWWIHTD